MRNSDELFEVVSRVRKVRMFYHDCSHGGWMSCSRSRWLSDGRMFYHDCSHGGWVFLGLVFSGSWRKFGWTVQGLVFCGFIRDIHGVFVTFPVSQLGISVPPRLTMTIALGFNTHTPDDEGPRAWGLVFLSHQRPIWRTHPDVFCISRDQWKSWCPNSNTMKTHVALTMGSTNQPMQVKHTRRQQNVSQVWQWKCNWQIN